MAAPPACLQCGRFDQVQRVAGIVASQRSPLSWELRAPAPPGWKPLRIGGTGYGWFWLLGIPVVLLLLIPFGFVLIAILAAAAVAILAVAAILGGLIVAAYGIWAYLNRHIRAERRRHEHEHRDALVRRHHHARTYWEQLLYCYRCHGVFLPGHPWQHVEVTHPERTVHPAHAWNLAERLAHYAERAHGPEVLGPPARPT
jgi:hypothetical protein